MTCPAAEIAGSAAREAYRVEHAGLRLDPEARNFRGAWRLFRALVERGIVEIVPRTEAGAKVRPRRCRRAGVHRSPLLYVRAMVGIYYSPTVAMPLIAMYGRGVRFLHGRVHSRMAMPEVLPLITSGRLQPERVTSRLARWDDAAEALLDAGPKVVVERA